MYSVLMYQAVTVFMELTGVNQKNNLQLCLFLPILPKEQYGNNRNSDRRSRL